MCLMFGKWNVITEWFLHPDILSDPGDNGAKFGVFFPFWHRECQRDLGVDTFQM